MAQLDEPLDAAGSRARAVLPTVLLFANTDWYLYNFRLALAKSIAARGMRVVLLCPPGEYVERLRHEGFEVRTLGMDRRSIGPWSEQRVLRQLVRIYREERPVLVHHFTIKCVVYGSIAALASGTAARVNAAAGLGYVFSSSSLRARLLRPLVRAALALAVRGRHARLILQNEDDVAQFVRRRIASRNGIRLIRGSGVDTQRFRPVQKPQRDTAVSVLMATRLLWDKGIGELIEAARALGASRARLRFIVAGAVDPGNPGSVSSEDVRAWEREGVARFLGHVDDMSHHFAAADIVVLPSYYGEGVPRVLLEAAACGLPIVATDMPGCRAIVRHEVNGLIVPPRDADALAAAIARLAGDPGLRHRFGAAGRAIAVAEFEESAVVDRTIGVYAELVPIATALPPAGR